MKPDLMHGFRTGPWLVEPMKGAITGPDGMSLHLQPKVMDVLVCLAENADEPVSRDQLLEEVWGAHVISDEPLTRTIGELRRALDDDRSHPEFIETIPKRGYRLIGDVAVTSVDPPASPARPARINWLQGIIVAVVLIIVAVSASQLGPFTRPVSDSLRTADAPENSIVVLPFTSCEDDEEIGFLAERIGDEVRLQLAQFDELNVAAIVVQPLAVIAKSSSFAFRQAGIPPGEIAKALNVRYMLTGNICTDAGETSIRLSLHDHTGFIKEAARINLDDSAGSPQAVNAANTIAIRIADWLNAAPPISRASLVAGAARDQLLIARQYLERGNLEMTKYSLESAVQIQPDYAEALFIQATLELRGLDIDQRIGLENARDRARVALNYAFAHFLNDPTAFETNFVVGQIIASLAEWERDLAWRGENEFSIDAVHAKYAEAESYLVAAVESNPYSSDAAELLADVIAGQGRRGEAQEILEKAWQTDPFNLGLSTKIALGWAATGRFHEAIELLQRFEKLPETSVQAWNKQLELMQIHGYWDEQCATLIRLLQDDPQTAAHGQIRFQVSWFIGDLLHLGLYDEAEAWRSRLPVADLPEWARLYADRFYLWGYGNQAELTRRTRLRLNSITEREFLDPWYNLPMNWAWDIAAGGDTNRAIELMEKLRNAKALYVEREILPSLLLARLYHRAGRQADAILLLQELENYLVAQINSGLKHPESLYRLAEVYALQEKDESALNLLRMAVDAHWRMPWWRLPWNTDLNGLDSDPRAVALRSIVEKDLESQAIRIREMLAQQDTDELLRPLRNSPL